MADVTLFVIFIGNQIWLVVPMCRGTLTLSICRWTSLEVCAKDAAKWGRLHRVDLGPRFGGWLGSGIICGGERARKMKTLSLVSSLSRTVPSRPFPLTRVVLKILLLSFRFISPPRELAKSSDCSRFISPPRERSPVVQNMESCVHACTIHFARSPMYIQFDLWRVVGGAKPLAEYVKVAKFLSWEG